MRIKLTRRLKRAASALLTALVICSIFSMFVVYYLSLIEQQNYLNARSQSWNVAISITEAGVEDGLEQLNDNTSNLGLAPWSLVGGNVYYRSNALPDGNSYEVYITNAAPNPVVVARGYVNSSSFTSLAKNISSGFFAAAGVSTASPVVVTRAVMVNCTRTSLFIAALAAKYNIDLNGNNITTDSYSSCNPAESVNGQYVPGFYAGDKGDIGSNLGVVDSISGGNANVYGTAHTGTNNQGQATIAIGPNGGVGTHNWQASNKGIEPGYALEDANFTFPSTTFPNTGGYNSPTGGVLVVSTSTVSTTSLPTTTATAPTAGTYVGTVSANKSHGVIVSYTYNLITSISTNVTWSTNSYNNILWGSTDLSATNYYVANSLSGSTIVVGDNVVLALPNGLSMSGNDQITIQPFASVLGTSPTAPAGAGVQVYAGGTSCAVGGNGVLNQPGFPIDFILYCAPTVTSVSLGGNFGFNGVLVAPMANLTMNGGGNNTMDFIGCALVSSATLNGHVNIHYDECLANYLNNPRYLVTAWNEVK